MTPKTPSTNPPHTHTALAGPISSSQPPAPGPLTTRVEESLPAAHLGVLLRQPPLRPAEALGREQKLAAALHELLQQL